MFNRKTRETGQGMTEYLIIVALIAISAIAVVKTTSRSMKVGFGKVSEALQGRKLDRDEKVSDSEMEKRNMSEFNSGVE